MQWGARGFLEKSAKVRTAAIQAKRQTLQRSLAALRCRSSRAQRRSALRPAVRPARVHRRAKMNKVGAHSRLWGEFKDAFEGYALIDNDAVTREEEEIFATFSMFGVL